MEDASSPKVTMTRSEVVTVAEPRKFQVIDITVFSCYVFLSLTFFYMGVIWGKLENTIR